MSDPGLIELVQQLLATGANGATIAIFIFLYKLDKRVHRLEIVRDMDTAHRES